TLPRAAKNRPCRTPCVTTRAVHALRAPAAFHASLLRHPYAGLGIDLQLPPWYTSPKLFRLLGLLISVVRLRPLLSEKARQLHAEVLTKGVPAMRALCAFLLSSVVLLLSA